MLRWKLTVSNRVPSWHLSLEDQQMSTKDELLRLISVLSEYECRHLFNAVQDITEGERFWEGDFGPLYDQYVKLRYFIIGRPLPQMQGMEEHTFVPIPIVKLYQNAKRVSLPPAELPRTALLDT